MKTYHYIIVGGGMTAAAAVNGIREVDETGTVLMISSEKERPYKRPPLSKGLWKKMSINDIFIQTEENGIDLLLGQTVSAVQVHSKTIVTDRGEEFGYGKILLATGGKVRQLPYGADALTYFRTLSDFSNLKAKAENRQHFTVIGSGFIGSEIAAALRMNGKDVTMIDGGAGIGKRIFPADIVEFLNDYYMKKGVNVVTHNNVKDVRHDGGKIVTLLEKGETIITDGVVAGIGILPETRLAEQIGLKVDNGIQVDEFLRTSSEDILAAGDNANFFNPSLGERIRVEHSDNANHMGKQAGRNMAGAEEKYHYLPLFYSDLFELGYEAVGSLDSRMEIVTDWQEPYIKGVLDYLENERVRGVLLWNVWDQVDQAREVIALPGRVQRRELIGKIK